eukprot:CAMPEP_0171728292 /NCGR_PEP_ID=MMETSP0991-20121206/26871_1 /TAXON_ID=483369 /ORGANISM="non described non described, Strain CCMP2098" /LENGTH=64 /DNA_ID=CAMNT_0012322331 /DNA_START=213 /DNA_END=407 /DNA_ORIENTATION=-
MDGSSDRSQPTRLIRRWIGVAAAATLPHMVKMMLANVLVQSPLEHRLTGKHGQIEPRSASNTQQ